MCHMYHEHFCPFFPPYWLRRGPFYRRRRWLPPPFWITVEEEIEMLEDLKKRLEDKLKKIDSRLTALKKTKEEAP